MISIMIRRLAVILTLCIAPRTVSAEIVSPLFTQKHEVFTYQDKTVVRLYKNPSATNPTFAAVCSFVETDMTDEIPYSKDRMTCTNYAVLVHDAAQRVGIRCALVAVDLGDVPGHTVVAFQTRDRGMVYLDCTAAEGKVSGGGMYDTLGYLEIGQPYGRLQLTVGALMPAGYAGYRAAQAEYVRLAQIEAQIRDEKLSLQGLSAEIEDAAANGRARVHARQMTGEYNKRVDRLNQIVAERAALAIRLKTPYQTPTARVRALDYWW